MLEKPFLGAGKYIYAFRSLFNKDIKQAVTGQKKNIANKRVEYAAYDGYFEQPPLFLRNVGNKKINVQKGPEFKLLEKGIANLLDVFRSSFVIRQESNRMAYRVSHDLNISHEKSIISSGTTPGTIQLTPAGDLMFLMRDAQTTGGYPRVLQLTEDGICDLSQMKAEERFELNLC
jgi:allophanate hydrolase subunit 2